MQHGTGRTGRGRIRDRVEDVDDGRSLTREERRRQREARRQERIQRREDRRRQKQSVQRVGQEPGDEEPDQVVDLVWLRANLSSLWREFRAFTRQQGRGHNHRGSVQRGHSDTMGVTEDHSLCPTGVESCQAADGQICSGHGECSCGHCQCEPEHYGSKCQCNDHTCQLYDGMSCGGPSRGQCRCGGCMCRSGYIGEACNCPTQTQICINPGDKNICSNKGTCECGRCHCEDGYKGMYCEDTVYAAGVCEKLKPCVLCKAGMRGSPTCDQCQITVTAVNNLEPSMTTCVMVNSGCILKYSYIAQTSNAYTVLLERNNECPSQIV
ncbi:Integrin beta-4-like [Homarus americanus]|uniref:Integrin beta-4-like n=2 Tax=Homarus americanus TaxID=6706 RepID=A0A8J5N259_HOMAM|nr:Integrin beta-4-like [Homarus americanus]